ncbi:unnamed protein product [Allacma fusca]|uniref:Uncharacterized protein n=1 Tax=Allacma fusca TaxID=39272 RepID=A0A8J2JWB2_9HEXA|nr:unnamed protein product [Allacma fusca]
MKISQLSSSHTVLVMSSIMTEFLGFSHRAFFNGRFNSERVVTDADVAALPAGTQLQMDVMKFLYFKNIISVKMENTEIFTISRDEDTDFKIFFLRIMALFQPDNIALGFVWETDNICTLLFNPNRNSSRVRLNFVDESLTTLNFGGTPIADGNDVVCKHVDDTVVGNSRSGHLGE